MSRIFAGLLTTFFALGVVFASPIRQSTSLANRGSGVATTVPEDRTQELKAPAKAKMAGIVYEVADWFESAANVVGDMFAMPPLIEGRSSMYPTPATYTYKGSGASKKTNSNTHSIPVNQSSSAFPTDGLSRHVAREQAEFIKAIANAQMSSLTTAIKTLTNTIPPTLTHEQVRDV